MKRSSCHRLHQFGLFLILVTLSAPLTSRAATPRVPLAAVQDPSQAGPPAGASQEGWEIGELIRTAGRYIDEFWSQTLGANHQRYLSPRLIRVVRPIHNVMYDPAANVIYCDYDFLETQMERHGDFAVVTILAHEWAHAVQTQLGARFSLAIERELQADCYAGVFAKHEGTTTRLEADDIRKAISGLYAAGDSHAVFDSSAHGSSQKRMLAFRGGLDSGFSGCSARTIENLALGEK